MADNTALGRLFQFLGTDISEIPDFLDNIDEIGPVFARFNIIHIIFTGGIGTDKNIQNFLLQSHSGANAVPGSKGDFVHGFIVDWVIHGDDKIAVFHDQGNQSPFEAKLCGKEAQYFRIDFLIFQADQRDAELSGQGLADIQFGNPFHFNENLPDAFPGPALYLQGLLNLFLAD